MHQEEPTQRVEEQAGVFHGLPAALVLSHVEGDAKIGAQAHPPFIPLLGLSESRRADAARPCQATAGRVPGDRVVEGEVVHPGDT